MLDIRHAKRNGPLAREHAPRIPPGMGFAASFIAERVKKDASTKVLLTHPQDTPFVMNDSTLSPSKETRQHHPYRSLYAALLFQSFRDALAETMSENPPGGPDEAAVRKRNTIPANQSTLAQQA